MNYDVASISGIAERMFFLIALLFLYGSSATPWPPPLPNLKEYVPLSLQTVPIGKNTWAFTFFEHGRSVFLIRKTARNFIQDASRAAQKIGWRGSTRTTH